MLSFCLRGAIGGLVVFAGIASASTTKSNSEDPSSGSVWRRGAYSLGLRARSLTYKEGLEEAQLVQMSLSPKMDLNLASYFRIRGEAAINLNSASVQTRFKDPSAEVFALQEFVAIIEPRKQISLEVGAVNQAHLSSDLLVDARAFPGALLRVGYVGKKLKLQGKLQSSIPTSASFESDRTELEETPSFQTQGVELYVRPLKWLEVKGQANIFQFENLPSKIAFESGRQGNTVNGDDVAESSFKYEFKGWNISYELEARLSKRVRTHVEFQLIENSEAPSGQGRSQLVGLGLPIDLSGVSVTPKVAYFFSEANSSPAYYNSALYGHNNREGMMGALRLDFKKLGFALDAQYVVANVINEDAVQDDMESISLSMELLNETF